MIFSIFFLYLTLLVYFFLPELRNLRGKILMLYMLAIISFYTFLFINTERYTVSRATCSAFGFITYGSAIIAILLLNVIHFDYFSTFLWVTFIGLLIFKEFFITNNFISSMKNFRENHKKKLFYIYTLYGIVVSSLLVLGTYLDENESSTENMQKLMLGTCFKHRKYLFQNE